MRRKHARSRWSLLLPMMFALGCRGGDIRYFELSDEPYNQSWSEWTVAYWEWVLQEPSDTNPNEGGDCTAGQSGKVWFLGGHGFTTGSNQQGRTCTVPAGKAIFLPILTGICYACPEVWGSEDCRFAGSAGSELCRGNLDGFMFDVNRETTVTVDGQKLPSNAVVRARSSGFEIEAPDSGESVLYDTRTGTECADPWEGGNECEVDPGPKLASTDGFWSLLKPLKRGSYEIHYSGTIPGALETDVVYTVTVE